jgi:ABC-type sugar transport system substrate-binding protein
MEASFMTASVKLASGRVLAACLAGSIVLAPLAAVASDHRIVLVPGGPHPYFAGWEPGLADAAKDFGIAKAEYQVPAEWKLETQTQLLAIPPDLAGTAPRPCPS